MAAAFSDSTTGMINITGTTVNEDPSYRYKMPRIQTKIEGRGNGIKTILVNINDISSALNRPINLIMKFFGMELGTQSNWDEEKATVNGAHTSADLQNLLNIFIDKFVLCPICHLPETALCVKVKKELVYHRCAACGAKENIDSSSRLHTLILNQAANALAAAKRG